MGGFYFSEDEKYEFKRCRLRWPSNRGPLYKSRTVFNESSPRFQVKNLIEEWSFPTFHIFPEVSFIILEQQMFRTYLSSAASEYLNSGEVDVEILNVNGRKLFPSVSFIEFWLRSNKFMLRIGAFFGWNICNSNWCQLDGTICESD